MVTMLPPALLMFALLFAATTLGQWRANASAATFTGDAAAHYVSGLMAHDWLLDHPGGNPVKYLVDYHAHLPLTSFGLWPPLYYGIEALWMLMTGTSEPSMLALSASMTALLGLTVGLVVARRAGWIGGLLAGLLLVGNPLVQRASNELMLDVANAFACFLAALAYAAYIQRPRRTVAMLAFGLLAATAMMIKYNALALAFLPPLCVLIGRRWDLLRQPGFYLPAVIVGMVAGPWYVMTHGLAEQGFQFQWGLAYLKQAAVYNAASIFEGLTPPIAVLAVIGLSRVLWRGSRLGPPAPAPIEIACAALCLSIFLFLLAIPIALQDRYLIPCLAPMLVLAVHETMRCFERLRSPAVRGAGLAALIASIVVFAIPVRKLPPDRLREVAQMALRALPPANPVMLVVADGGTEPALIAAIAMAEPQRPAAWVIRGSRLFGGGGYNNADYQPRFTDPGELLNEINHYGISLVIFQHSGLAREWTHVAQFGALLTAAPQSFATADEIDGPAPIRIVRVLDNETRQPDAAALTNLNGPRALLKLLQ